MGKVVKVVVWIHMITGDTSGHNELCGKFNSNGNTQCPYRCCLCSHEQLSDSIAQCTMITLEDVSNAKDTPGGLEKLSVHDIKNAFSGVPISDTKRGIFGICPAETLHVLGNGVIKYQFACNVNLIGPGESRKKQKMSTTVCSRTWHVMLLGKVNVIIQGFVRPGRALVTAPR